jgi:hypothetical protein
MDNVSIVFACIVVAVGLLMGLQGSMEFVLGLMAVGLWLESINGKHGFWDEMLTPSPMGLGGVIVLIGEAVVT